MHSKLLDESGGRRTFAVILAPGDEVVSTLKGFATKERIRAAQMTAIGALSDAVLAYFDIAQKKYLHIPVREQAEVASLIGDVALDPEGQPTIHVHVVLGKRDGSALAGHLAEAHVQPTLEVIINESPAYLQKVHDPATGLALIHPQETAHA
jgi:predicted DNA-binding protein with PD1-like motif